jgi:hypothetical protein
MLTSFFSTPWSFNTSKSLPKKLERNTKRTNSNHFQLMQRTNKEWTEHGITEEYHADDDLEHRKAPHVSCNMQKFPSNAKTRIKT